MTRPPRILGVLVALCAAAAAAGAAGGAAQRTASRVASCPSAVRGLGRIAFVAEGRLQLVDLSSCRVRALASRAAGDVQFSADGRWVAYAHSAAEPGASPAVVSVSGGTPRSPLGTGITAWWWAPTGATLFGVDRGGQLVQATPDGVRRVAAHGARTFGNAVAPSPDGQHVASDSSACLPPGFALDTIGVSTGERHVALSRRHRLATFAGWSPDGHWLLYWAQAICSASLSADGWPLDAVPAAGGHGPTRAVTHMLLYPDYLTWCGTRLIAAAGPSRETQLGSALVATGPPSWHQRTIAATTRLSWVSPACAPSGSLLAAAAGPSSPHSEFGIQHRSIWLLSPTGERVRRITTPPASNLTDEAPRFSRDGHWILFVRSHVITDGITARSQDTLELVPAAPSGPAATIPIATFTSADVSFYDHFRWPSEIAWSAAAPG